jgi:hypothetical protein
LWLAGCQSEAPIQTYRVPKQHVVERLNKVETAAQKVAREAARPERMLAAIVPQKGQGWFFKLSGPPEQVGKEQQEFQAFIESIEFTGPDSNPKWKLPKGWEERPGEGLRHATIEIDVGGDKPLELSVTTLPRGDVEESEFLLANINRWRGQVSLPPIKPDQLNDETTEVKLADGTATVVDLKGMSSGSAMGRAPFAGGGPMSSVGTPKEPAAAPAAPLEFTTPKEWTAAAVGRMSKAEFEVKEADERVRITVIDLEPSGGELLANVNRWRGQVKLRPIDEQQLKQDLESIKVDGHQGHYVELIGPGEGNDSQAILGVIVHTPQKAWFFKLMGDSPLAEREKARFKAFVGSVKFK